jgi:probable phosphoglycerate mutase
VQSAFEGLAAERNGQRVLVVAHGGVLASLYRVIHKLGVTSPYNIPVVNASYNAVAFDGSAWTVEAWADTAHLGDGALFEPG